VLFRHICGGLRGTACSLVAIVSLNVLCQPFTYNTALVLMTDLTALEILEDSGSIYLRVALRSVANEQRILYRITPAYQRGCFILGLGLEYSSLHFL
jgi:hypothetical protein